MMTGHHLEQDEDAPLWEAVKKAGAYLDSINQHDLRALDKGQLMMFGSIIISAFAENRASWFENQRHPDDNFRKDFGLEPLDDEIPF
tara:strand:- start:6442 stop:6702 length:261 start_codon:yes stop_codon:yes gene_type:complete